MQTIITADHVAVRRTVRVYVENGTSDQDFTFVRGRSYFMLVPVRLADCRFMEAVSADQADTWSDGEEETVTTTPQLPAPVVVVEQVNVAGPDQVAQAPPAKEKGDQQPPPAKAARLDNGEDQGGEVEVALDRSKDSGVQDMEKEEEEEVKVDQEEEEEEEEDEYSLPASQMPSP